EYSLNIKENRKTVSGWRKLYQQLSVQTPRSSGPKLRKRVKTAKRNPLLQSMVRPEALRIAGDPRIVINVCFGTTSRFTSRTCPGEMVIAEALDFPGAVSQGFDLMDARLMIASALEDLAQTLLEDGKPLPVPSHDSQRPDADLIELVPLSVHAGTAPR